MRWLLGWLLRWSGMAREGQSEMRHDDGAEVGRGVGSVAGVNEAGECAGVIGIEHVQCMVEDGCTNNLADSCLVSRWYMERICGSLFPPERDALLPLWF